MFTGLYGNFIAITMVLWKLDTRVQTGYGPEAGPCNRGNELSDSVQEGEFYDQASDGQFFKK